MEDMGRAIDISHSNVCFSRGKSASAPAPALWARVNDLLGQSTDNNEVIITILEEAVSEQEREDPQFIRTLVTSVVESCIGNRFIILVFSSANNFRVLIIIRSILDAFLYNNKDES